MWQREGDRLELSRLCCSIDHTEPSNARGLLQKGSDTWGGGLHCQHCGSYRCHCGDLWASQSHQRRAQHILKGLMAIIVKSAEQLHRRLRWIQIQSQHSDLWQLTSAWLHRSHGVLFVWSFLMAAAPGRSSPAGVWQLPNVIQAPPADPAHSCSQMLLKTDCCYMKGSIKINHNRINHIPIIHAVACMQ